MTHLHISQGTTGQIDGGNNGGETIWRSYCDSNDVNDQFCIYQIQLSECANEVAATEGYRGYIIFDKATDKSFIVDGGRNSRAGAANPDACTTTGQTDGETMIRMYNQLLPGKIPNFIFLTHGHPDHWAALADYAAETTWSQVPFYIGVTGVKDDTRAYNTNGFAPTVLNEDVMNRIQVVPNDLNTFGTGTITIINDIPAIETSYASMLLINYRDRQVVIAGDLVSPKSHLYATNFYNGYFDWDVVPSDCSSNNPNNPCDYRPTPRDGHCQWANKITNFMCSWPDDVEIYAGHGPASPDFTTSWREMLWENVRWLRDFDNKAFTECDGNAIWNYIVDKYPDLGMTGYVNIGATMGWGVGVDFSNGAITSGGAAEYMGCTCGGGAGNPITTDCSTATRSVPVCGVLDQQWSIDQTCAALGLSTSTVAGFMTSTYSSGGNDDSSNLTSTEIGLLAATFVSSAIVLIIIVIFTFMRPKNGAPSLNPHSRSDL